MLDDPAGEPLVFASEQALQAVDFRGVIFPGHAWRSVPDDLQLIALLPPEADERMMPVQMVFHNFDHEPADLLRSELAAERQAAFIKHLQVHQPAVDLRLCPFALGDVDGITGQQTPVAQEDREFDGGISAAFKIFIQFQHIAVGNYGLVIGRHFCCKIRREQLLIGHIDYLGTRNADQVLKIFTCHQHAAFGGGHLLDVSVNGRVFHDQGEQFFAFQQSPFRLQAFILQLLFFEHGMDRMRQPLDMAGSFYDIIRCAALDGLCSHLFGAGAGHDDHRQMREFFMDGLEDLQAFKSEDVEIAQDQVKTPLSQRLFKLFPRSGLDDFKASGLFLQCVSDQFTVERVIIHIKDAKRSVHGSLSGGAMFNDSQYPSICRTTPRNPSNETGFTR